VKGAFFYYANALHLTDTFDWKHPRLLLRR